MSVRSLTTLTEFRSVIAANKLSVLDCAASWCGPCKMISPMFTELAQKKPKVQFLKIDVDEAREIAQDLQVRAMPTFFFFHRGQQLDKFEGADVNRLNSLIEKYEKVATPAEIPSDEELHKMSAKQLLSLMAEHNISSVGLPEKSDLIGELTKARK